MDAIRHADGAPLLTRLTLARLEKQLLRLSLLLADPTTGPQHTDGKVLSLDARAK